MRIVIDCYMGYVYVFLYNILGDIYNFNFLNEMNYRKKVQVQVLCSASAVQCNCVICLHDLTCYVAALRTERRWSRIAGRLPRFVRVREVCTREWRRCL